jgi:sortase (surface protein transpeptidase)
MSHAAPGRPRGDRLGRLGLVVAVAALAGLAVVLVVVLLPPAGGHGSPVTRTAQTVREPAPGQPAPTVSPGGPAARPATLLPDQPTALHIPSIGLNANVGALAVRGGEVDPPTPRSAYWLSDFGLAGPHATNTVYIAGHTWRGGQGVFNPLLDVPHSSYAVHAGDEIVVDTPGGSYDYTVTDTELYEKVAIADQSELWRNSPGRLVLVTCFQYDGGTSSHQNFVVYAQLDGAT